MRRRPIWDLWLLTVALVMTAFGVFMALFGGSGMFESFRSQLDPAFWPAGFAAGETRRFQAWVFGVWGATVAGLGALAAVVIQSAYRERHRWARNGLAGSIALWFALDTGISIAYSVWFNVAFNLAVLAAIVVPMAATWNEFQPPGTPRGDVGASPPKSDPVRSAGGTR